MWRRLSEGATVSDRGGTDLTSALARLMGSQTAEGRGGDLVPWVNRGRPRQASMSMATSGPGTWRRGG
jgi:hypothetical protein